MNWQHLLPNRINNATDMLEGSWVVARYSCFPSPHDWSIVSLCPQQLLWWFSWSLIQFFTSDPHLVHLVFCCTPSWELGSFILVSPQLFMSTSTSVVVSLDSFFSPTLGAKLMSCFFLLSCFSTWHFTLYLQLSLHSSQCDMWVLAQNQDQDTRCPDSIFADLFWVFAVDRSAKYIKE